MFYPDTARSLGNFYTEETNRVNTNAPLPRDMVESGLNYLVSSIRIHFLILGYNLKSLRIWQILDLIIFKLWKNF